MILLSLYLIIEKKLNIDHKSLFETFNSFSNLYSFRKIQNTTYTKKKI